MFAVWLIHSCARASIHIDQLTREYLLGYQWLWYMISVVIYPNVVCTSNDDQVDRNGKESKMNWKWTAHLFNMQFFFVVIVKDHWHTQMEREREREKRTYIFYEVCSRFVSFIFLVLLFLVQIHVHVAWQYTVALKKRHRQRHTLTHTKLVNIHMHCTLHMR